MIGAVDINTDEILATEHLKIDNVYSLNGEETGPHLGVRTDIKVINHGENESNALSLFIRFGALFCQYINT